MATEIYPESLFFTLNTGVLVLVPSNSLPSKSFFSGNFIAIIPKQSNWLVAHKELTKCKENV
jgi:hypothetical protein